MPRGGKRKNSGGVAGNLNASGSEGGGKRENSGAPERNSNGLGNQGGGKREKSGAPERNLNALGNQGGARLGNSNSSSRAKKISTLFAMGVELDNHGEFLKALSKYREVIELEPKHADAHNCIARLLTQRYYQGDFFNSGSFLQIAERYKIADSGGCSFAKKNLYVRFSSYKYDLKHRWYPLVLDHSTWFSAFFLRLLPRIHHVFQWAHRQYHP